MNHPRFLEWIGVPQSACLLEMGAGRWVDYLSRNEAVAAAVQLQRMLVSCRQIFAGAAGDGVDTN